MFEEADKNGDGTLDMKEVLRIMQRLNIGISKKVLKQKFKVSHMISGDGHVILCDVLGWSCDGHVIVTWCDYMYGPTQIFPWGCD